MVALLIDPLAEAPSDPLACSLFVVALLRVAHRSLFLPDELLLDDLLAVLVDVPDYRPVTRA
jgi:hypothetical protein